MTLDTAGGPSLGFEGSFEGSFTMPYTSPSMHTLVAGGATLEVSVEAPAQ